MSVLAFKIIFVADYYYFVLLFVAKSFNTSNHRVQRLNNYIEAVPTHLTHLENQR